MSRRNVVLIPAAGVGARFGADVPKQYVQIAGKTVLEHTVAVFERHADIDEIAVVVSPEDVFFQTASDRVRVLRVGGETRAQTVCNGLNELYRLGVVADDDNVLVHDAARCCLPQDALSRLLLQAGDLPQGGILAVPVADTVKRADDAGGIGQTVSRQGLWLAQTPQLFRAALLQQALAGVDLTQITDEASAVEKLGVCPALVLGDVANVKLTLPQDERLVRLLLQNDNAV